MSKKTTFVIHYGTDEQGRKTIIQSGILHRRAAKTITLNPFSALLLFFGIAETLDELQTVPRSECREFVSFAAYSEAYAEYDRQLRAERGISQPKHIQLPGAIMSVVG